MRLPKEKAEALSPAELKDQVLKAKMVEGKQLIRKGRKSQVDFLTGEDTDVFLANQCRMAAAVSREVYKRTSTFEDIGKDLAYLLGAIVRNGFVEWHKDTLPALYTLLLDAFPKEHQVWDHIAIVLPDQ